MLNSRFFGSFNRCFHFLIALLLILLTCMWLVFAGSHADGRRLSMGAKSPGDCARIFKTDGIPTIGCSSEDLFLDPEEYWEAFLALQPARTLSSFFPWQASRARTLSLHQTGQVRKIYLRYRSFLC